MSEYVKNELIKKLKTFDTLPFLFVGSGLSRRYIGSESWEELLEKYASIAKNSEFGYRIYSEELKNYDCEVGENPKLASLIELDFNQKWLTNSVFEKNRQVHKEAALSGISPFKIEIAEHLKEIQKATIVDYEHEIKLFKDLSGKNIAGIITTNYDNFLESCFDDYVVYIGQDELIFSVIQGVGEIYKIHGCVSRPNSIIINEDDYLKFINKNAYLAAKILTIFLEHPIIFIGYSINDPNIEEILKSIVTCLTKEQLDKLRDRFIFVEWNNSEAEDTIKTYQKSFNDDKRIEMTHLYIKDYSTFYECLSTVRSKYKAPILRKLKTEIADLVLTNEPSHSLKVVNLEDDKLEDLEIVVGVGVIRDLAAKGYEGVTVQEIYEDVVFDNKNFDNELIVEKALPTLLKRHNNSIPFYKYIKDYQGELPSQIRKEIKEELNQFLNRTILQTKNRVKLQETSISQIAEKYPLEKSLEYICYLDEKYLEVIELKEFLQKVFKENINILIIGGVSSNFRRVVKIYDWLKHYK